MHIYINCNWCLEIHLKCTDNRIWYMYNIAIMYVPIQSKNGDTDTDTRIGWRSPKKASR